VEERVALGLVVRAVDRVGPRHEHRDGEALPVRGEPLEIERRLREDDVDVFALDDRAHRIGKPRFGARGHEVEGVAEVPADGSLGHVGADEAHIALPVPAQRAQERRRAGSAGRGDEHGDRAEAHGHVSKQ
jgi:hypothetical protein